MTNKNATLPVEYLNSNIGMMRVDESGWTVPWSMDIDVDRRCWLDPSYTIHHEAGGTVQMRIERREDGYHVWLDPSHRYTQNSVPKTYLPVVGLHKFGEDT